MIICASLLGGSWTKESPFAFSGCQHTQGSILVPSFPSHIIMSGKAEEEELSKLPNLMNVTGSTNDSGSASFETKEALIPESKRMSDGGVKPNDKETKGSKPKSRASKLMRILGRKGSGISKMAGKKKKNKKNQGAVPSLENSGGWSEVKNGTSRLATELSFTHKYTCFSHTQSPLILFLCLCVGHCSSLFAAFPVNPA